MAQTRETSPARTVEEIPIRPGSDSREARRPLRPAPARFGAAGISAGQDREFKTSIPAFPSPPRTTAPMQIARSLGWFSIGLGVAELFAARPLARWLGMENRSELIRAYGAREVATGALILAQSAPAGMHKGIRARVLGDAMDIATLASGLKRRNPRRGNVGIALGLVAGVTLADVFCAALLCDR